MISAADTPHKKKEEEREKKKTIKAKAQETQIRRTTWLQEVLHISNKKLSRGLHTTTSFMGSGIPLSLLAGQGETLLYLGHLRQFFALVGSTTKKRKQKGNRGVGEAGRERERERRGLAYSADCEKDSREETTTTTTIKQWEGRRNLRAEIKPVAGEEHEAGGRGRSRGGGQQVLLLANYATRYWGN